MSNNDLNLNISLLPRNGYIQVSFVCPTLNKRNLSLLSSHDLLQRSVADRNHSMQQANDTAFFNVHFT